MRIELYNRQGMEEVWLIHSTLGFAVSELHRIPCIGTVVFLCVGYSYKSCSSIIIKLGSPVDALFMHFMIMHQNQSLALTVLNLTNKSLAQ